jgi:DNA repair protein REV1
MVQYGIRFENDAQAETFMYQVAEEVARRLDSIEVKGKSLTLKASGTFRHLYTTRS